MLRTMSQTLLAAGIVVAAMPALAQTYPTGPIRMIVGYAAGGTGDVVARQVAPKLQEALGQSVVVENRAGASGAIAAHTVATAAPDGLTLLVGQTAEVAINQHMLKGLSYDDLPGRHEGLGLFFACIAFMFHQFFDFPTRIPGVQVIFISILAALWGRAVAPSSPRLRPPGPGRIDPCKARAGHELPDRERPEAPRPVLALPEDGTRCSRKPAP